MKKNINNAILNWWLLGIAIILTIICFLACKNGNTLGGLASGIFAILILMTIKIKDKFEELQKIIDDMKKRLENKGI